ncbi:MAG: hypothetical protein HZA54_03295 [Planctomycetes bacterium]|nr:hypothetical protein [Planctomycetota bacterium]
MLRRSPLTASRALLLLALSPLFVAGGAGCSMKRFIADQMAGGLDDQMLAFDRETSVRHAREAGPALLKMLDGFLVSSPDNPALLVSGARLNTTFAFALLEEEDAAWARELYIKARGYGLRALAQRRPALAAALAPGAGSRTGGGGGGPELAAALAETDRADLAPLFWTAYAWGSRINLQRNSPDSVAELPAVQQVMQRVIELDPAYFNAAPHLFFGVTLGARSAALGGDLAGSRTHFEAALAGSGRRYLLTQVLYARFYAVSAQDRTLFVKLLTEVKNAPAELAPEQALANAIARRRAEKLLAQVDDLILPELPAEPAK